METNTTFDLLFEQLVRRVIREEIENLRGDLNNQDKLLDADEAASLLCVSSHWLYRHASKLPFTRKLGPKLLRFSLIGIQKYLATRKFA